MRRSRVALSCLLALSCLASARPAAAQEKPKKPADETAKPAALSPRARIERALKQPIQVKFDQTPLDEAVWKLSRKAAAPIFLDRAALKLAGKDAAAPISLPASTAPLRAILERMLDEVGLAWGVQDGVLIVTTPEAASNMIVTAVYPVKDLLAPAPANAAKSPSLAPAAALGGDADMLIELVTNLVESPSWAEVGGAGSIQSHAGALVVSNTEQVQLKVQALLAALRQAPVFDPQEPCKRQAPIRAFPCSPADARTRQLLEQPAKLEVESQPLDEVLAQLAKRYGVPIEIDREALARVGLGPRAPITFRLAGISLRSVLKRLLDQYDLDHRIRRGAVVVTTPEEMENWPEVVLYPVGDLLQLPQHATLVDVMGELDSLIELVTMNISPNAWEAVIGPGPSYAWPQRAVLAFEHSPAVQAQIADLFRQMRAVQAEQPTPTPDPPSPKAEARATEIIFFGFPYFAGGTEEQLTPLPEIPPDALEAMIRALIAPDAWGEPNTYLKVIAGRVVVKHRPDVVRAVDDFVWELKLGGLSDDDLREMGVGMFNLNDRSSFRQEPRPPSRRE